MYSKKIMVTGGSEQNFHSTYRVLNKCKNFNFIASHCHEDSKTIIVLYFYH